MVKDSDFGYRKVSNISLMLIIFIIFLFLGLTLKGIYEDIVNPPINGWSCVKEADVCVEWVEEECIEWVYSIGQCLTTDIFYGECRGLTHDECIAKICPKICSKYKQDCIATETQCVCVTNGEETLCLEGYEVTGK